MHRRAAAGSSLARPARTCATTSAKATSDTVRTRVVQVSASRVSTCTSALSPTAGQLKYARQIADESSVTRVSAVIAAPPPVSVVTEASEPPLLTESEQPRATRAKARQRGAWRVTARDDLPHTAEVNASVEPLALRRVVVAMSPGSRRSFLLGSLAAALSRALPAAAQPRPIATVALAPLGPFPAVLLDEIDAALRAELGAAVVRMPPAELPRSAWYAPRRRYRAERLLDFLRPRMPAGATRVLGVTEVDISTTAHGVYDWGLLGLGDIDGRGCVISTFRCRMHSPSERQTRWRMTTTSVHEVGHTLGLEHCPDTRCLMTDARGRISTVDHTTGHLCASCRRRLGLR